MKCEAIFANRALYSVAKMCRAFQIKQCEYYQWLRYQKKRQQRKEAEKALTDKVRKVFVENRELYGCRKMRAALMNEGLTLSEWKIRRIMTDPEKAFTSDHNSIYLPAAERDPCGFFSSG